MKQIKSWLVTASAPFCGTEQYYCAFSEGDPLDYPNFPYEEIVNDLWDSYSWMLQAYENWECDCSFDSEEMSLKDLQDYIPGGPKSEDDLPEIIYDERNHD